MRRRPARIAALTTALVVLICVAPAAAATLTVNTTTDEVTPNDGLCSLREAISAVNAPPGNGDCGLLTSDNTIALGGQPYALTRQPAGTDDNSTGDLTVTTSNPVTISGAGAANTSIDATGLHDRVLDIAAGANVTLTELRVRGGQASDGSNGQPVASCPSQDGGAGESGGGIRNAGSLTLLETSVTENRAGNGGNGATGSSGSPSCAGGNGGAGGSGGGVYNTGTLTLTDATISGNIGGDAGRGGGGPTNGKGNGGAGGCPGDGGGIASNTNAASVTITASTISGNRAGNGGGGGDGLDSDNSTGAAGGNGCAGGWGGGASVSRAASCRVGQPCLGSLTAINSTIAGNFAGAGGAGGHGGQAGSGGTGGKGGDGGAGGSGGGVRVTNGPGSLLNVTLAANGVGIPGAAGAGGNGGPNRTPGANGTPGGPGVGGGLFVQGVSPLALQNTIVASDQGGNCGTDSGSISNGGHNLSFDDGSCPGINGDPKLGLLADNGGPTRTMALGLGSAAIDQIPTSGAGCPSTDQRGVPRPQQSACDIGAYEYVLPAGNIGAGTSGGTTGAGPNVVLAAVLRETLSPSAFPAAPSGPSATAAKRRFGTKVTYSLNEAASVRFTVVNPKPGRKRGGRCVKPTKANRKARKCTRLVALSGSFTLSGKVGMNSFHFTGRVGRRRLKPGKYQLVATPIASRRTGRSASAKFRIIR